MNIHGKIFGAITIIVSLDHKLLLVRNGNLWGLPKGARNYRAFMDLKLLTESHYNKTGEILIHDKLELVPENMETAIENAYRETLEETGIKIDIDNLESYGTFNTEYCAYDRFYYNFPYDANYHEILLKENVPDHENDELKWFNISTVADLLSIHNPVNKIFNHITYKYLMDLIILRQM